ncbi:MAG: hypothetical protein AB1349_05815 [Elusimicrobiota bacterium]
MDKKGAVLLVAVIGLVTLSAFGITLVSMLSYESKTAVEVSHAQKAFSLAEAGIEKGIYYLVQASTYRVVDRTEYLKEDRYIFSVVDGSATGVVNITSTGRTTLSNKTSYLTVNVSTSEALHPAFSYAVFTGNGNAMLYNSAWVSGNVLARGNVYVATNAKITDGTAAATGKVYGPGKYTKGTLPSPVPTMPTLTTTYYDTLISSAQGQPPGNKTYSSTVNLASSTILVRGNVTITGSARIIGPGRIVATGTITVQQNSRVENNVELIANGSITIRNNARIINGKTVFSKYRIYLYNNANVTASIVAQNNIYFRNRSLVNGIVYSSYYIYTYNATSINGSVVVQSAYLYNTGGKITYNVTYASDTPTGIQKQIISNVSPIANTWFGG